MPENAMDLPDIVLYFAAAAAGGAINAVAGGGTFLVFPLLIFGGMGSVQANIMSTIALWPGAVASAFAYRGELKRDLEQLPNVTDFLKKSIAVSMAGSLIGTVTLLMTPEVLFKDLVPWLLLFASVIFTFGRHGIRWLNPFMGQKRSAGYALQFATAVYGGYFGAGIGILMLAMLQLLGLSDIHQMNSLKTILGSAINVVAWTIFLFSGKVIWGLAALMIAGALIGGWFGAKLALKVSPQKVRALVSVIGFATCAYFFVHGV